MIFVLPAILNPYVLAYHPDDEKNGGKLGSTIKKVCFWSVTWTVYEVTPGVDVRTSTRFTRGWSRDGRKHGVLPCQPGSPLCHRSVHMHNPRSHTYAFAIGTKARQS